MFGLTRKKKEWFESTIGVF